MSDLLAAAADQGPAVLELPELESPLLDILSRRRSIRKLARGPFPRATRERLYESVRLTPSAYNLPPWRAVFVLDRREEFWDAIESGFRAGLSGDRLDRFLGRLEGYRGGLGAVLFLEDLSVQDQLKVAWSLTDKQAAAFVQQSLGMAQLSLWLALTHEGLATSLQHWDWLVERQVEDFLEIEPDTHHVAVVMPFGYPAEQPRETETIALHRVVGIDRFHAGTPNAK